jgi:hypothetical protein
MVSVHAVVALSLMLAPGRQTPTVERPMFRDNLYFPKGGLGIIRDDLYVVLRSDSNELRSGSGGRDRWTGNASDDSQLVVFFRGKILDQDLMPTGFNLAEAVVVSFEGNVVRFFDFSTMSGGYYKRPSS